MPKETEIQLKRVAAVLGIIVSGLLVLTAAKAGAESWLMPRAEVEKQWARQMTNDELRSVRDSARQEMTNRRLAYLTCRADFTPRQCAHLTTP